jgi:excinuclease UvrABC helicase subunit UvrB
LAGSNSAGSIRSAHAAATEQNVLTQSFDKQIDRIVEEEDKQVDDRERVVVDDETLSTDEDVSSFAQESAVHEKETKEEMVNF